MTTFGESISTIPFANRFGARLRTGTRPPAPAGLGDAHWDATATTLSIANADASAWIEYDFGLLAARTAANGGTGFSSFTTGDLLVGNPASALSRLPVGPDTDVLTADNTQPLGMNWASAPTVGGTKTAFCALANGTSIPINSATSVDAVSISGNLTGAFSVVSNVLTCNTGADYLVRAEVTLDVLVSTTTILRAVLKQNGTPITEFEGILPGAAFLGLSQTLITPTVLVTLAGSDTLTVELYQNSGSSATVEHVPPTVISQIVIKNMS